MVALGVALDSAVGVGREALVADELEVGGACPRARRTGHAPTLGVTERLRGQRVSILLFKADSSVVIIGLRDLRLWSQAAGCVREMRID
jgi:hypothetical protein